MDAPREEIESFYAQELSSRGWADGGGSSGISGTNEFSARAWHKDDVVFRLGFLRPDHIQNPGRFSAYDTLYDVRLIGKQVDE